MKSSRCHSTSRIFLKVGQKGREMSVMKKKNVVKDKNWCKVGSVGQGQGHSYPYKQHQQRGMFSTGGSSAPPLLLSPTTTLSYYYSLLLLLLLLLPLLNY